MNRVMEANKCRETDGWQSVMVNNTEKAYMVCCTAKMDNKGRHMVGVPNEVGVDPSSCFLILF